VRGPDKTEADGSIPSTRTKLDFVIFCGGKQRFARPAR